MIGNPPYIGTRKVADRYTVRNYQTQDCPDVYAWCLERASKLLGPHGWTGMIVPLSLGFSGESIRCGGCCSTPIRAIGFSSFGRIPAALFNYDVRLRNTIHLGARQGKERLALTSRLHRWFEAARPDLFHTLEYAPFDPAVWKYRIPKINTARLGRALEQCLKNDAGRVGSALAARPTPHVLYSRKTAYNWLAFSRRPPPCFDAQGTAIPQSQLDALYIPDERAYAPLLLLLNGRLAFAFWCIVGDDFHVARWTIAEFPFDFDRLRPFLQQFSTLAEELTRAMAAAVSFKRNAGKTVGNYNLARCRRITDQSDRLLAHCLGLDSILEDVALYCSQVVKTDFGGCP